MMLSSESFIRLPKMVEFIAYKEDAMNSFAAVLDCNVCGEGTLLFNNSKNTRERCPDCDCELADRPGRPFFAFSLRFLTQSHDSE